MIADIIASIIDKFLELSETLFETVFGGVDFAVLWSWLPSDIGSAAAALVAVLFGVSLISLIRRFLPF